MLGSRCAAEACLHRCCRPEKPMPTLPSRLQAFAVSADSPFMSPLSRLTWTPWSQLSLGDSSESNSFTSSRIGEKTTKTHSLINISFVILIITRTKETIMVYLALSVPLTLFNLSLLLNSHCRPYVQFPPICGSSNLILKTSMVCATGLGLSAPRPCGCVGWPLIPLHVFSPGVAGRPSAGIGLSPRRPCGRVRWLFPLVLWFWLQLFRSFPQLRS